MELTSEQFMEAFNKMDEEYRDKFMKWDRFYLGLAEYYSKASKDPSTKVGAVVVNFYERASGKVVGLGYNGFPPGVDDNPERYNNRELKYKLVTHAEVNACVDAGPKAAGATLYVFPSFMLPPICNECCKIAIASGISEIVGYDFDPNDERAKRWEESIKISRLLCEEADVAYRGIPRIG